MWTKTLECQALQVLKASASIFKYQKNLGSLVLKTHLDYLTQLLNLFYVTVQKNGATDIVKKYRKFKVDFESVFVV